jgi:nitrogen regulatory protein P-II 2
MFPCHLKPGKIRRENSYERDGDNDSAALESMGVDAARGRQSISLGAFMWRVMAVIQPTRLAAVREALGAVGVQEISAIEVTGFGRQKGHTGQYRGVEYAVDFLPKVKIELLVTAEIRDQVIEAIETSARTGRIGDGKIFVFDLG